MSPKLKDFDQRLRRMAASLPRETPPTALRTRILEGLPMPKLARPKPSLVRLAAAGLVACLVAALLVAGPHFGGLRSASAAEVHAAILRANTWHFVGWHLRDGQKVRWEVWGRRSPYLYREQIGDEVYLDDGTRSTHILPPDPKNGREHGVVLILPSQPHTSAVASSRGTGEANLLVGIGGDADQYRRLDTTGVDETFTAETEYMGYPYDIKETATLTVDKTTQLPVRYIVNRLESQPKGKPSAKGGVDFTVLKKVREYAQAELSPTYGTPLPVTVAEIDTPADYTVADATEEAPKLDQLKGCVVSQSGLTVWSEVLGQDTHGDLHLRFYSWLGSKPLSYRDTGLTLEGALAPGDYGIDNLNNSYLSIPVPGGAGPGDGGIDLWLVPAEPVTSQAQKPIALKLTLSLSVTQYEGLGKTGGRLIPVTTQEMGFHLGLPTQKHDLGYEATAGRPGKDFLGARPSLAVFAAEAREDYYINQPSLHVHGVPAKISYGRAAYWAEAAAQAATRSGDTSRAAMDLGNAAAARRLQKAAP